jgi:hypothetical protein
MSNWAASCNVLKCTTPNMCCKSTAVLDQSISLTNFTCTDSTYTCKLQGSADFKILVTTLLIILGFTIGIPILILIIDFFVIRRPCKYKMSVCEFFIFFICLCKCKAKKAEPDNNNKKKKESQVEKSYEKI